MSHNLNTEPLNTATSLPSTINPQPSTSSSIHPACALCHGACCEIIGIDSELPPSLRYNPWYKFHGIPSDVGTILRCQCSKLGTDGLCTIYATRPRCCELAPVGDKGCRTAIHLQRPDQEQAILALIDGPPKPSDVGAHRDAPSHQTPPPSTLDVQC